MPIAKTAAIAQLKRMNGLNFKPMEDAAIAEITGTLAQVANSSDDAEEIVSIWLRENVDYPKPAQLIETARRMVENRRANGAPAGCEACQYTGYRPIEEAQAGTVLTHVRGVEFCACSRGQWRKQKWQENRGAA